MYKKNGTVSPDFFNRYCEYRFLKPPLKKMTGDITPATKVQSMELRVYDRRSYLFYTFTVHYSTKYPAFAKDQNLGMGAGSKKG